LILNFEITLFFFSSNDLQLKCQIRGMINIDCHDRRLFNYFR